MRGKMQGSPGQSYIDADVQPPDPSDVDWKAAPLRFKLYHNCDSIVCAHETIRQPGDPAENGLTQAKFGQILSDIYGFTRQYYLAEEDISTQVASSHQLLHDQQTHYPEFSKRLLRPVPSGGGLYPCELYLLVGPRESFPPGIYHYDAAHHTLDIIRPGDYSHLIQNYLAHPAGKSPAYTLLLSCFFWKDGFKYGAFSYRLQGLDIGTVISQSEVISGHYGLEAWVHYQFLDRAIDDLIDLDPLHESIYAVITLSPAYKSTQHVSQTPSVRTQEEPSPIQPLPTAERLESIARWPLLEAVHRASLIQTRDSFRTLRSLPPPETPESMASQSLCIPDTFLDLWQARNRRHSTNPDQFRPLPLTEQQFAQLLIASTRGYANDIDGRSDLLQHTLLYCIVNHVQNIPAGIYYYHPERHVLELVRACDICRELQEAAPKGSIHPWALVSVCLLPVGNYKRGFEIYGDRWYRMQNMEAGIIVQRLYLAAAALRLGCRASLGYQIPEMDELLCLPEEYTSLIQIMVAPEQYTYRHYEQSLVI